MKKMLMMCALAAGAFATAQVAHADSFIFTFSGSTGSGHNQQTISGTVTFHAPAGGGAITAAEYSPLKSTDAVSLQETCNGSA